MAVFLNEYGYCCLLIVSKGLCIYKLKSQTFSVEYTHYYLFLFISHAFYAVKAPCNGMQRILICRFIDCAIMEYTSMIIKPWIKNTKTKTRERESDKTKPGKSVQSEKVILTKIIMIVLCNCFV